MLVSRSSRSICRACKVQLYSFLSRGFVSPLEIARQPCGALKPSRQCSRAFHKTAIFGRRTEPLHSTIDDNQVDTEIIVRQVRQIHGDTLPDGLLSPAELTVYKRLYGEPLSASEEEYIAEEFDSDEDLAGETVRELEELEYEQNTELDFETERNVRAQMYEDSIEPPPRRPHYNELQQTEMEVTEHDEAVEEDLGDEEYVLEEDLDPEEVAMENARLEERLQAEKDFDEIQDVHDDSAETLRTHPFTLEGRSGTTPSTIFLSKDTVVNPIAAVLSTGSNKHLSDISLRAFGGIGLPDSVATPSAKQGHLQQKPVALEASQSQMMPMEAHAYIAGNIPGIYASLMGVLVEVRKRLGSKWLEDLMQRAEGPRILDAGGGGAGILAWRDVLRAEWERMHPPGTAARNQVPLGRATAVIGSNELGTRASAILENATIIPRLPDFVPLRDLPGSKSTDPLARKQYDIVIAPHSLWTLKEDYMRKAQVQNFWSLLDPDGGVLIILEKGVPRGFELVAGARETLLKNHIASPGSEKYENEVSASTLSRYTKKEVGMIVAPCTNHGGCPMYTIPGQMSGRKDHCHFSQRFIRPQFLQQLVGVGRRGANHEDIRYSYVAVQRGRDLRKEQEIYQNESATLAALKGFEHAETAPTMLSLPRVILSPIKRHKHVVFDLCTPSGQLERWTLPASKSKQAYRDARKSSWGDLWALGAKTRTLRDARSGTPQTDGEKGKKKKKSKTRYAEGYAVNLDSQGRFVDLTAKENKKPRKDERESRERSEMYDRELGAKDLEL